MVGAPAIDVEPHSQFLSSDTLLSPSGPLTNTTSDNFPDQIPLSVLPDTAAENPLLTAPLAIIAPSVTCRT